MEDVIPIAAAVKKNKRYIRFTEIKRSTGDRRTYLYEILYTNTFRQKNPLDEAEVQLGFVYKLRLAVEPIDGGMEEVSYVEYVD